MRHVAERGCDRCEHPGRGPEVEERRVSRRRVGGQDVLEVGLAQVLPLLQATLVDHLVHLRDQPLEVGKAVGGVEPEPVDERDPLATVRPAVLVEEILEPLLVRPTPELDQGRALPVPPAGDARGPVDPEERHVVVLEGLRERGERAVEDGRHGGEPRRSTGGVQQGAHQAGVPRYGRAVLLVPCPEGHVAVAQPAHGWMCGQLARAWGNGRFGSVDPFEEVCLAAEQHDTGWAAWEQEPTLDRDRGLPHTFDTTPFTVHLEIHRTWSHELVGQSRYAALLVSLHHASFFEEPGRIGRMREGGRRIHAFLEDLAALQSELRRSLDLTDEEVERNRRLVRTWDGLSHDLLLGLAPRTRRAVPTADGLVDLAIDRDGDDFTVAPWPFVASSVTVRTEGRLLGGTFSEEEAMREALAHAPWVALSYTLRAG